MNMELKFDRVLSSTVLYRRKSEDYITHIKDHGMNVMQHGVSMVVPLR